ncbi:MAG: hypothetical protein IBJ01_15915 [Leptospira sp.]|uniref:hypothetical protein n=1 Tax=Leptospira sp. TaxID=178 RepID=UPI0025B8BD0F|nr:hypothetical protein [Leptospira sp.]MBL0956246.1 hypothetical protein [Leptospira sp.]
MPLKYLYFSWILFSIHCSFANLNQKLKPVNIDTTKGKTADSITIINHTKMYYGKTPRGEKDFGPGSYFLYLSEKQKEIGRTRYQWKDIQVYDINDKSFQFTNIKSDYVFFVTVHRPKSDWDEEEWKHIFQVLTFCILPCKQNVSLDVSVKLYYKNSFISEKVSHLTATRYLSPWYLPVPFAFQMRDYGTLFNEPSVYSALYLNGFQESIDGIYEQLPNQLTQDTSDLPE